MRLCILGCILSLVGLMVASAKIKNEKTFGCDGSHDHIKRTKESAGLPYDGGIVTSDGEYIPGIFEI